MKRNLFSSFFYLYDIYNKTIYMSKRMLISESEKNRIRNMHEFYKNEGFINEGNVADYEANLGIQCFLNKKKITDDSGKPLDIDGKIYPGSKSSQAIAKYQKSIGANADGVWGYNTMDKMSKEDKMIYDECQSHPEGTIFQKIGSFLGFK